MKSSSRARKISLDRLVTRRTGLNIGASIVTTIAVLSLSKLKALSYLIYTSSNTSTALSNQKKNNRKRTFRVIGKKSLKQSAAAKGIIYGAFPQASRDEFDLNCKWKATFLRECNLVVAACYWADTQKSMGTFDFSEPDYLTQFAATNQMLVRGHPLVWHLSLPKWIEETLNHQNAEQILTNHVHTLVKRYAGKMHSWDVVNEAIEVKDGRSDRLRNTPWLEFLGADYINLAFQTAASSDPKAILVYNEHNLEYDEAHQVAVLQLLQRLKAQGTPVHALGIQSHLRGHRDDFNPQRFKKFLKNVAKLGFKILVTELDVIDQELPLDPIERDRRIASTYEQYLSAVLSEKAVIAVINWGLSDRYTWLNKYLPRPDRSPSRPLPFDRDLQPKLAFNAMIRAFARSPKR